MRYGTFLKEHGRIGFVAPSFGCATEPYRTAFDHALKKFDEMGYQTVLGANCRAENGIGISNTPELCAKELEDYYCADTQDVLISCGGGELMCEILPHLDFDKIRKAPAKWYMGYSDNTNFTFLLPTICDTAAIYGPCAATFGMEPWDVSLQHAFELLKGERLSVKGYEKWEIESLKDETHPTVPYNLTEKRVLFGEDAVFSGRLLGGCLDILTNLVGTAYDRVEEFQDRYKEDGIIWFLEACDLNVFSIRRALWQMKEAGWFQTAKGFLIGRPRIFDEPMMGLDRHTAVTGILSDLHVPIIQDLDIGHLPPMLPLVCGSLATVEVKGNDYRIEMKLR